METQIIHIKKIDSAENISAKEASHLLEKQTILHFINTINWKEYSYKPKVSFRIGYSLGGIFLKFYVEEKAVRAVETRINGDVYKDSCVEFFISFDGRHYYNFEFNCIGTPHVAYGEGRRNRQLLPEDAIKLMRIESSLGNRPFDVKTGDFKWELTVIIPVEVLVHDKDIKLHGLNATANFYKCGDELPEPHFVTWNPVETEQPDYHRPEFFGKAIFERK